MGVSVRDALQLTVLLAARGRNTENQGLARRGGLDSDRLVLVGIGVWYASVSLSTFLLVRSNPWDTPRIYTWLSGSTYGRTWEQVTPVAVALVLAVPLVMAVRRELDLLALDEDTPRCTDPVALKALGGPRAQRAVRSAPPPMTLRPPHTPPWGLYTHATTRATIVHA